MDLRFDDLLFNYLEWKGMEGTDPLPGPPPLWGGCPSGRPSPHKGGDAQRAERVCPFNFPFNFSLTSVLFTIYYFHPDGLSHLKGGRAKRRGSPPRIAQFSILNLPSIVPLTPF